MEKQDLWTAVQPVLKGATKRAAVELEKILIVRLKPRFNVMGKLSAVEEGLREDYEREHGECFARRPWQAPQDPETY